MLLDLGTSASENYNYGCGVGCVEIYIAQSVGVRCRHAAREP